jgi:phage terminase small subunit
MALSSKERRFVSEYLVDQNATKAAERAGYSVKTARQLGSRLLSKVNIQTALNKSLKKVEESNEITADRLDRALLALAEADIRKAFNADGTPKAIHDIPDDVAKAISSVEMNHETGEITRFRFAEKVRPIELLLKRKNLLKDLHEHTGKDGKPLPPAVAIDLSNIPMSVLEKIAGMNDAVGK